MATARIYQPPKPATQSGLAKTRFWLLEFAPEAAKERDRLMGWTGSRDPHEQIRIRFPSREAAVAFAEREGLDYRVEPAHARAIRPKSYADNFRPDRPTNWTH